MCGFTAVAAAGRGWGRVLRWRRRGVQLCSRPWRFLWWTSLCSSATSSSSLRVRAEGASDSVHPLHAGQSCCATVTRSQCQTVHKTAEIPQVRVQFLVGVDMPVVVQRLAPGSGQCMQLWSSTVAVLWRWQRRRGRGRQAAFVCFQPGVGAHHTGDELN